MALLGEIGGLMFLACIAGVTLLGLVIFIWVLWEG
jgi:hypothetical protein